MPKSFDVKFDPQARRSYLTSFSSKKKQRRAFGLAMQKVKDRREKIEQRKEHRKRVIEAENEENNRDNLDSILDAGQGESKLIPEDDTLENQQILTTKFVDPLTHANFGGEVIVTTTFNFVNNGTDGTEESDEKQGHGVDIEQKFAGSVKKYLNDKLPSRKRKNTNSGGTSRKKGKHGALGMKGMGSTKDLKLAEKTLKQAKSKIGHDSGKKSGGNKKHKGRRGARR